MVKITIEIDSTENEDVALILEQIAEKVMEGYTSGQNANYSWERSDA